jgi:MSHA biogenesis protein MshP
MLCDRELLVTTIRTRQNTRKWQKPAIVQQGFLIPMAFFIVIAASSLAVAMSHMAAGAGSSAVQYALNAQAFYAAEAGIEWALHRLYYGADSQSAVDTACTSLSGSALNLTGQAFAGCTTELTCSLTASGDGAVSLYAITSESLCGSGDFSVGRRLQIEAYMQDT